MDHLIFVKQKNRVNFQCIKNVQSYIIILIEHYSYIIWNRRSWLIRQPTDNMYHAHMRRRIIRVMIEFRRNVKLKETIVKNEEIYYK